MDNENAIVPAIEEKTSQTAVLMIVQVACHGGTQSHRAVPTTLGLPDGT